MSWNEEARISCRFSFKCPRLWGRLQPTADEGVRHCPECDRDVHLALTEENFRQHSEEGRCGGTTKRAKQPSRPMGRGTGRTVRAMAEAGV